MWNKNNLWFKSGFVLVIVAFIGLNVRSYIVGYTAFLNRKIRFSHEGFGWGFPLRVYQEVTCFPCDPIGSTLMPFAMNLVAALACAALVGVMFEIVAQFVARERHR